MARPTDWSPLADSDPVPGDPQRISEQAARLASAAQQIQGQVSQLRAIEAGQSEERGLHVDKLKSASADVAGSLEQVVGRYQKTSSALSAWIPELEYAQSQSPERQHPAGHDPRDLRPRPRQRHVPGAGVRDQSRPAGRRPGRPVRRDRAHPAMADLTGHEGRAPLWIVQ